MTPRQFALPLVLPASAAREDLIADASNAEALTFLDRKETWPGGRLALYGPAGVGKSHMGAAFAATHGWRRLDGPSLRGLPPPAPGGTVLDDADAVAEETALLHLLNLSAERGEGLLLIGREPPARWPVRLPDLASRLRSVTAIGIGQPGDALLAALLAKLFADRQLRVAPEVQAWLLARLPREAPALVEAVARLDRAALAARGPVTRALARAALADWPGFRPGDEEEDAASRAEVAASPREAALL
jgi:chromosomal replication initiation ATPase DnaA